MRPDKFVVDKMRISLVDARNLLGLARRKSLAFVEAPDASKESLPVEKFVDAGDTPGKSIRRVKQGCIGISNLLCQRKRLQRNLRGCALRDPQVLNSLT